jgi:Phosphotransferase enzyme family
MSALPDGAADLVLAAFGAVGAVEVSVVHGDPGPPNIGIGDDGRVGLLDWDESRVDVVFHDLSELCSAMPITSVWCGCRTREAANAWFLEPDDARNRLTHSGTEQLDRRRHSWCPEIRPPWRRTATVPSPATLVGAAISPFDRIFTYICSNLRD